MHYAKIDKCEYINGKGCGISLYVSGCHFHCNECFNSEAWDFNYGEIWNRRVETQFISAASKVYIKRVSFLGGEPLADENVQCVLNIIEHIKSLLPDKKIWVFTGYVVDDIISEPPGSCSKESLYRKLIITMADYIVDGRFELDKRDITLAFRGSSNQRVLSNSDICDIILNTHL